MKKQSIMNRNTQNNNQVQSLKSACNCEICTCENCNCGSSCKCGN